MTEIGTLLQDRYLIEEKIGTGGMGAVFLGIDKRFDNRVAIKETIYKTDEFADAFEREARLLNGLQHPALPYVSDYFAENNGYYIVMQYIEGEDLSDALKGRGSFQIEDVLRWTDSLLDALDYLHSQNPPVIHRDIKPHNLKLTTRGDIMLLDFGLAKLSRKDATEVSVFGYSRTYSPLEQIQGTGTDARSDIFALAATVYHLLTGKPPVNALTRAAAIVNGNADPLKPANEVRPEIPESVANVIQTALMLNPQNRFLTAKAMRQALEYAVAEIPENKALDHAPAVVGAAAGKLNAETEKSFPALESFAAAKNAIGSDLPPMVESLPDKSDLAEERSFADDAGSSPLIVDISKPAPRGSETSPNKMIWAAAAILLFIGIAAAFYFGGRNDPASEQTVQSPNVVNTPAAIEARETKSKSTSGSEKSSEKVEAEKAKTEAPEKAKTEPEKPLHTGSKQPQEQPGEDDETADPEEDSRPTPIELLPENPEPKGKVKKRPTMREIPDSMSEEEFQQIKREEKARRRARNDKPDEDK